MFDATTAYGRMVGQIRRRWDGSTVAQTRGHAVGAEQSDPIEETVQGGSPDVDPAAEVLGDEERGERLAQLNSLIELMRPAVQADGGDLALLFADVSTGVVEVQLQGACSSCAVSASTLQGGVDRILRDRLPWVTEVRGGVDESVDPFESESMGRGGYVPSF
jgi:Fe-S cluster biogenesis protein NfuA